MAISFSKQNRPKRFSTGRFGDYIDWILKLSGAASVIIAVAIWFFGWTSRPIGGYSGCSSDGIGMNRPLEKSPNLYPYFFVYALFLFAFFTVVVSVIRREFETAAKMSLRQERLKTISKITGAIFPELMQIKPTPEALMAIAARAEEAIKEASE